MKQRILYHKLRIIWIMIKWNNSKRKNLISAVTTTSKITMTFDHQNRVSSIMSPSELWIWIPLRWFWDIDLDLWHLAPKIKSINNFSPSECQMRTDSFKAFQRYCLHKKECWWGHSDLELWSPKIESVPSWVPGNVCTKFEVIPSRHSWDMALMRMGQTEGRTENPKTESFWLLAVIKITEWLIWNKNSNCWQLWVKGMFFIIPYRAPLISGRIIYFDDIIIMTQ